MAEEDKGDRITKVGEERRSRALSLFQLRARLR